MRHKVEAAKVITFALFLLSFSSFTQEVNEFDFSELSLEDLLNIDITISATQPEAILDSVSTVSVITAEQIRQFGFTNIAEAASSVAGFDVLRTYLKQSLPTARGVLQDHYANKVLVMINGVPTWHAITGEGNLERVNIHQVSRIEILKGPASVLYGTNAYSGAINIVLHGAESISNSVNIGVGSDGQHLVGAHYVSKQGLKGNYWSVSGYDQNESKLDFEFTDELANSGYVSDFIDSQNISFQGKLENNQWLVNVHKNVEGYLGVAPKFTSGAGNPQQLEGILAGYQYQHQLSESANLLLKTKYDWNRRVISRNADNDIKSNILGQHWTAEVIYNGALTDKYGIEVGASYDARKSKQYSNFFSGTGEILSHNNMQDRDVSSHAIFTQLNYHKNNLKWLLGLRRVDNELFGQNTSARGTIVYQPSSATSYKLIMGQSYRTPSLFELYFRTDSFTVFGNPALKPEKSSSIELAYLKALDHFFWQANLYYASYDNKIYRVKGEVSLPDGTLVSDTNIYENGEPFNALGAELELRYSNVTHFDAFFNLSVIDGNDGDKQSDTDHYNFKYVPELTLAAGVSKRLGDWLISSVVDYRSSSQGPQRKVDSNLVVDISIAYQTSIVDYSVYQQLKLSNLFDKQTEIAEYVRLRGPNQIPIEVGRAISYQFAIKF